MFMTIYPTPTTPPPEVAGAASACSGPTRSAPRRTKPPCVPASVREVRRRGLRRLLNFGSSCPLFAASSSTTPVSLQNRRPTTRIGLLLNSQSRRCALNRGHPGPRGHQNHWHLSTSVERRVVFPHQRAECATHFRIRGHTLRHTRHPKILVECLNVLVLCPRKLLFLGSLESQNEKAEALGSGPFIYSRQPTPCQCD
jgi:hypothetical protein